MPKQPLNIDQTTWSNEPEQEVKTGRVKTIVMMVFSGLISILMFLIATPFFIVIWTINFIKSLFGMVVMWVVGKFCILLFLGMVFGLLHNILGWVNEDTANTVIDWYTINVIGMSTAPADAEHFFMFPQFRIESWIIVIIALILATVSTIYRDEVKAV